MPSSKGQYIPGAEDVEDEQDDEDGQDANLVTVVLGPKGRGHIFYEWHQSHPNDSVAHVVDGWAVTVALTPGVREALGAGILKQTQKRPTPLPPSVAEIIDQRNLVAPAPAPSPAAAQPPTPAVSTPVAASATKPATSK